MVKVLVLRASGKIRPISIDDVDIIQIPVIKITPNENVINKISLEDANYMVIMSTTVVKYLRSTLEKLGDSVRVIGVGPQTCNEMEKLGVKCEVPSEFSSYGIIEMMKKLPRGKVVILRSLRGNDYVKNELQRIGYYVVEYGIYDLTPDPISVDIACRLINYVDYVVFMSSMTYETMKDCAKNVLKGKTVIAIGRVTANRMKSDGINALMPGEYTLNGVLRILINHLMISSESLG
ncbi:uroporphyrinogen-III synthase [Vulcanisaeta souniana]|uniref:Uroporphyrinogen III methyltransferase n=1 Tax=Vulcanisaeta souniana JCM 11219 TaxID=1293586 RepID=A0A830ECI2_9CREN|nr:uroporphyrinogen-III synthase [Vulcanisaeta souniana]BDR91951.1 uroporphyrinogen III methyltransferase [Vulcanisaeta souniana JCM 11219]GGI69093.1 uroporphyrinogen III methyltransferase [Vulcanisaeta souniana JCM 11219]